MKEWFRYQLFTIWVWMGHKVFGWHYIDIYSPGSDKNSDAEVIGITFSSNRKYVESIQKEVIKNMADKDMTCKDCGAPFIFTDGEQKFYTEKGFSNPVRCIACRKKKRAERDREDRRY